MITHELKTSLNAISGGLQLLDSQNLSYDQQDTLAIISKGSQHLELTLEQIIQLNKILRLTHEVQYQMRGEKKT